VAQIPNFAGESGIASVMIDKFAAVGAWLGANFSI
jgi:hypothetical protein